MILDLEIYKEQIVKQYLFKGSLELQSVIDEIATRSHVFTQYPIIGFQRINETRFK